MCVHAYVCRACTCVVCACAFACVLGLCMLTCACVCMHVRKHACACACSWLYAYVGVCMCVCVCLHACVLRLVHACVYVCVSVHVCVWDVCACMYMPLFVCLCICAHRYACRYVCVCACVRGCVHAQLSESVRVPFLSLHHLRPGNHQWGWLACPLSNSAHTLVLLYLLLNPLLSFCTLAAVEPCEGLPSMTDTALTQKRLLNIARYRGSEILWSQRPVEGQFWPLIQTVYIRIMRRIYIRRLKFTYGHMKIVYTSIYTVRNIRRIYTYTVLASPRGVCVFSNLAYFYPIRHFEKANRIWLIVR